MFDDGTSDGKSALLMIKIGMQFAINQINKKWFKSKDDRELINAIQNCIVWIDKRLR